MAPATVCIVGIGGYGASYVHSVAALEQQGLARLSCVVIRNRAKYAAQVADYEKRGVRIYPAIEDALEAEKRRLDLVAIPAGIPHHRVLAEPALRAGFNVVLEKPPTATIQDLDALVRACEAGKTFCQIGFQSQFNEQVLTLRRWICDGRLGDIRHVVAKARWSRMNTYYTRNPWAGAFKTDDGLYVLDGTVNNPTCHYLNLGLSFASRTWNTLAEPVRVRAELYKAHDIESEDTSCVEVQTAAGAPVYFYSTMCCEMKPPPEHRTLIEVTGTKGRLAWPLEGPMVVEFGDGSAETIPEPADKMKMRTDVFLNAIRYARGEDKELTCSLQSERAIVLAVNGAFESTFAAAGGTIPIAREYLDIYEEGGELHTEIKGINALTDRAGTACRLYSDLGVPWARRTAAFPLAGYREFAR